MPCSIQVTRDSNEKLAFEKDLQGVSGEGREGLCHQMEQYNLNQRGTKEHGIYFKSLALTIFQILYILVIVIIIIII